MFITSATQQPVLHSSKVVIDWSDVRGVHAAVHSADEVERLIDWVRAYPRRSNIHVVLGGYRNHHAARKLHSRLQALGCTVIARHVARKA